MTLIGKARGQGNIRKCVFGFENLPRCEFNPQSADVVAEGVSKVNAEGLGQVDWVDAGTARTVRESQPACKLVVDPGFYFCQPLRGIAFQYLTLRTESLSKKLQRQAFQYQRSDLISLAQLSIHAESQSGAEP